MTRRRAALLFLALAALAAVLRFPRLADRPMHADEGVNADKVGTLLEHGRYEYSTVDFHGPTLIYAALVVARLDGRQNYRELNETVLRALPAACGVLLVAAHFWLIPYLGVWASACAALFTAVSPAMVFYSRYFIHETLLVLFTFCALLAVLAYLRRPSAGRAILVGALCGLMYATKETWIIAAASMALAAWPAAPWWRRLPPAKRLSPALPALAELKPWWRRLQPAKRLSPTLPVALPVFADRQGVPTPPKRFAATLPFALPAFTAVALLFLSSFGTHPRGIVDSVIAYRTYFARGAGVNTAHVHPWYYYFVLLKSQALLAALALVGVAIARAGAARFIAIYTVLMAAVYCAIPYKAPWNLLSFLHGMILLAAIGAVWLAQRMPKLLAIALVGIVAAQLGWQARADSFQRASDPRNAWVYAHTGAGVFTIVKQIDALAAAAPQGRDLPIQIFTRENLWPLPWYLRRYPNVRWWNGVSDTAPLAQVILATPDMEPALVHRIYDVPPPGQREMYVPMFDRYVELRPRVEVRGYVAKSLWDVLP